MMLMTLNSLYLSHGLRKRGGGGHDTVLSHCKKRKPLLEHLGPIFSYRIGQQVGHCLCLNHSFRILLGQV